MQDMLPNVIIVRAEWDAETGVWTAESADVPGFVTEAETIEALRLKLPALIADLVEANQMTSPMVELPISIHANDMTRVVHG